MIIKKLSLLFPGFALTLLIATAAQILGNRFPLIGASVFGILFGILVKNLFRLPVSTADGVNFSSKAVLQFSIILLGGTLSLAQILETGSSSLIVMIFTILSAFIIAYVLGSILKIDTQMKNLIGVGTAICGGSAIAAISSITEADDHDISYSISTIFLFNVLAVVLFPPLGHLLGLTDYGFGLFAGTAINDTSSVVAAGYTFSNTAGDYATIVKLTRTTMIIPISIIFMIYTVYQKKKNAKSAVRYDLKKIFPWFILGFLGMAVVNTTCIIGHDLSVIIKESAKFMIVMALSAIGLKTDLKRMMKTGFKPLILGLAAWLGVSVTSLLVQYLTRQI